MLSKILLPKYTPDIDENIKDYEYGFHPNTTAMISCSQLVLKKKWGVTCDNYISYIDT